MNILILNWRDPFHPLAGGAELSLLRHAQYWKKRGAQITWVGASFMNCKNNENVDGIFYIRLGNHYTVHFLTFFYFLFKRLGSYDLVVDSFHFVPFFSPLYMRNVKKLAIINEPAKNAWFKNIIFPFSIMGYLLEPLFFIPYRSVKFMTSAESIKNELINSYHIPSNQITIVPHGYDGGKGSIKKRKNTPTIIYVSRISKDKGIEDALKAIKIVSKKYPNILFWIVGKEENSAYLRYIKRMVKKLVLSKHVRIWGFITEDKKFDLLSNSWILVHPSIREGWGLNVIEANSVGVPAVGYNVTGLRDSIRNNVTGILTKNNTPKGLADSIDSLLSNENKLKFYSENARIWSKKFDWNTAGQKSWKLINTLKSS